MTELKTGDSLPIWQPLFQKQAVWGGAKSMKSGFLWICILFPISLLIQYFQHIKQAKDCYSWPKTSDQVVPGPPATVTQCY